MPSRFATPDADALDLVFDGELWYWRGPSPFVFVRVPDEAAAALRSVASAVTYGWGMIPVTVRIGGTTFATSLFPKDGGYLVPIKVAVQRAERIATGDTVTVRLAIRH